MLVRRHLVSLFLALNIISLNSQLAFAEDNTKNSSTSTPLRIDNEQDRQIIELERKLNELKAKRNLGNATPGYNLSPDSGTMNNYSINGVNPSNSPLQQYTPNQLNSYPQNNTQNSNLNQLNTFPQNNNNQNNNLNQPGTYPQNGSLNQPNTFPQNNNNQNNNLNQPGTYPQNGNLSQPGNYQQNNNLNQPGTYPQNGNLSQPNTFPQNNNNQNNNLNQPGTYPQNGSLSQPNTYPQNNGNQNSSVNQPGNSFNEPGSSNIYPWLPSMNNIFNSQTNQTNQELKPFGYELFNQNSNLLGSVNNSSSIGNDYIVGPGDELQINIWGSVSTSLNVVVDRDGKIILPEVGTFSVTGKNFGSLKEQVRQKLSEIFNNVSVDISLTKLKTLKVYVVGEAKTPGAYDITSLNTLFNVLFMAGGPSNIGSLRNIDVIRNNKVVKKIDLYSFILRGDKSGDIKLENGDTVYFNLKGKTVGIQGLVNRPAIYEIKNEKKLSDIINLSGGAVATSYLKNVQVKRVDANREMVTLNVDMTSKTKIAQFDIKDKDTINIFPILSIDKKTIYLNGHVFRPGTYAYTDKMKLSNVIKSYSDLLPEPYLQYAQIIRLQQPDLKPYSIMFNLEELLSKKKDFELKPFDTIIVYSKWDFTRVPEATVTGEIFKPGKYKIVKGTKLIDLVSLAGGLTKDTYLDRIEIIRKDDIYGNKKDFSVSFNNAIKGIQKDNIEIKDEDIIIFHSNSEISQDKKVSIAGQVTKPGEYPLGKEMRVKDLINLSGNFTKSAFTQEAELIRYTANGKDISFSTIKIDLQRAIDGDPGNNIVLKDLDRLLIKQIPHWSDIGMTIELQGQVKYPGIYAVSPNDHLDDVIERAGGFLPDAYLSGAVFNRLSVKDLQRSRLEKLTSDIEQNILIESNQLLSQTNLSAEQLAIREKKLQYRRDLLEKLKKSDVTGRMVIDISNIQKSENSDDNVKIEVGDVLMIPKKPDYISVQGEVYNQTAIVYKKGKNLGYYLAQAGGATPEADLSRLYLIKSNGSVISGQNRWLYNIKDEILDPGDTILLPQQVEKTDYLEAVRDIVDIAYKTATAAGIFLLRNN